MDSTIQTEQVSETVLNSGTTRKVEHSITVAAPAATIYALIADVGRWPLIFPPTIHVIATSTGPGSERIRIWATANGEVKNWTSTRILDAAAATIEFRQEVSSPPVASMTGTWIVEDLGGQESRLRLEHEYRAVDDDPRALAWIDSAVDRNSRSELAALKLNIENSHAHADLVMSFEDTVRIHGRVQDVYDFLNEAQEWKQRLPHVARVELIEKQPGLQSLEMDTRTKDGSTHTTKSFRVCLAPDLIVYKQVTLPALMTLHTGFWQLVGDGDEVVATSSHTVVINEAAIGKVLGPGADVAGARTFIRGALSGNSGATLALAKAYAESVASGHV